VKESRETFFVLFQGKGNIGRTKLNTSKSEPRGAASDGLKLKFLNLSQVKRIDDLLAHLGEYGELHLIIQHGELRYINKVESYKAWKTEEEAEE
jgi:hypothetical protein